MKRRDLALAAGLFLLAGCGSPAAEAPARPTAAAARSSVGPSAVPLPWAAPPAPVAPSGADAWPLAPDGIGRVLGVYWPRSKDPRAERDGMAALTLDEVGRAWLFVGFEEDVLGFVVAASVEPTGVQLEAAAGVKLPGALQAARFRVEGAELVEDRGGAVTLRRTRDPAPELALLAPGTRLEPIASGTGSLRAHGPLIVGDGLGRRADECWVGLVLPRPPAARAREKGRAGRLVGSWIGDSLKPAAGAPCGLAARASAQPVALEGAIADVVLLADGRGPLAFVAVGYMAALAFMAPGRAAGPALERAVEEGLRAAE
jgi:hypothetical protein